jgi:hypothetical protein
MGKKTEKKVKDILWLSGSIPEKKAAKKSKK